MSAEKLHLALVVKIIGTASGLSLLVLWSRLIAYGLVFVNAIIVLSFDVFSLWSITLETDFTNSERFYLNRGIGTRILRTIMH